jgi:integrase
MKPTPGIRRRHRKNCLARENPRLRCDCAYEAEVYDRHTGDKIRKQFRTEAEGRAWRADVMTGLQRGTITAAGTSTTVNDVADELLAGMEAGSVRTRSGDPYKPSTVRSYEGALRDYVRPDLGAMRIGDVKRRHVQALADRLVADGYSPSTVRNALMPLRVIFRRAIRNELIGVNPTADVDLPANRGRRDRIVGVDAAAALIAALPDPFDRALWATALYAGLRRGELNGLRWSDVNFDAGTVSVERAFDLPSRRFVAPKSWAGVRRVPIARALRHALLEHRVALGKVEPNGLVFAQRGEPIDCDAALDRARGAWAATAVGAFLQGRSLEVALEPVDLHEARHTAASTMIAAGVNLKALSEFMGHASITTTVDRYGHLLPNSIGEATALLDQYLDATGNATGTRP